MGQLIDLIEYTLSHNWLTLNKLCLSPLIKKTPLMVIVKGFYITHSPRIVSLLLSLYVIVFFVIKLDENWSVPHHMSWISSMYKPLYFCGGNTWCNPKFSLLILLLFGLSCISICIPTLGHHTNHASIDQ